jgi:hypothetical protein
MREITKVRKTKEKKLFILEGIEELNQINFDDVIPTYAKQIEITYSDSNKVLKVDYITDLSVKKYEEDN